ncbi:MAG: CBS domain-containing protein [Rhodospirillales bacterium]|nr:CBS domain-containing protein [Rhodospirillales bacterium]
MAADDRSSRETTTPLRSQTAIFTKLVRDFMGVAPFICPAGARLGEVVVGMTARQASSALVVDAVGRIVGIVTEQDIVRRVAFQAGQDTPIDSVMTRPVRTVAADDYLYRAVARMRRLGLRHMPVVDAAGRPAGLLDLNDALAAASGRMMGQIDRLTRDSTLDGLSQVKQAQAELASELLADNLPAPEIQGLITDINCDIHRRILDGVVSAMAEEGWGAPPVPFTLLIMGSGGRGENFLYPDQDNGFILANYPDDEHGRIDPFFIALAERFTKQLDTVGFPLCRGNVMASNPLWRKTASQWKHQFNLWAERRSPVAVLFADIFLDFRAIAGPVEPATELREFVMQSLAAYPALLSMMCVDETSRSVALGMFGRIVKNASGDHPGRVDLKMRGTMPLVASVRLMALAAGVPETGTLARIAALGERGTFDRNDCDEIKAAFEHVTHILLRQQLADYHAGRKVGNYVDPDTLSRRERDLLVDSLRAIDGVRKQVRADLTGALW